MPDNVTYVPIQTPTVTHNPITGGDTVILATNPWIWAFVIGAFLSVFLIFYLRRWAKKQSKKTLDMVNPSLEDLDTTAFSLTKYLAIQGGLAIVISTVCTVSLLFVLIDPLITVLTCAASIGLSGYGREKAMNAYRSTYKNRQNLEGYMRTKRGEKRRYNWVNVTFLNPYTNDEGQYKRLKAAITKINADKAPDTDENKKKILSLNKQIEELYKDIDTIKNKIKVEEDPKAKEELEESIKALDEKILELETSIINLGEKISEIVPKTIDIDKYISNPILINDEYLVIVIARGNLKHNIDFVKWFDYDLFGEFEVPTAGPELRELTSMHRVKTDPNDDAYRMDEYIPVFVSVFDDRLAREMLVPIETIDMETNDMIAALATAQGVERKHTAGEINTSKALTSDLLNEDRDFDLLVAMRADSEAMKVIDAERKLKTLDTISEYITPPVVIIIVCFVLGAILGFLLGQNSILVGIGMVTPIGSKDIIAGKTTDEIKKMNKRQRTYWYKKILPKDKQKAMMVMKQEQRKKMSERMIIDNPSTYPEVKVKRSIAAKKQWKDPKYRARIIDAISGENSPTKRLDVRTKISNGQKERWKDPKYRALRSNLTKEQWKNSEFKTMRTEIMTGKNNPMYGKHRFGEDSPGWQGGKSFEPYGPEFNDMLKQQIRERDNHECQECHQTEDQLGYTLNVHHIDYDKRNNATENLISLCNSCHSQTGFNREDWTKYFNERVGGNK